MPCRPCRSARLAAGELRRAGRLWVIRLLAVLVARADGGAPGASAGSGVEPEEREVDDLCSVIRLLVDRAGRPRQLTRADEEALQGIREARASIRRSRFRRLVRAACEDLTTRGE